MNSKQLCGIFLLLSIVLSACKAIPEVVATETAEPRTIHLKDIAIVDGDLPGNYVLGVELVEIPIQHLEEGLPTPENFYIRYGQRDTYQAEIYLYSYETSEQASLAFVLLSKEIPEISSDFGEFARIGSQSFLSAVFSKASFVRCNIAVLLVLPSEQALVRNYAIRLDQRIQEAYCE